MMLVVAPLRNAIIDAADERVRRSRIADARLRKPQVTEESPLP
jgi:hypothetical protein